MKEMNFDQTDVFLGMRAILLKCELSLALSVFNPTLRV